MSRKKWTSKFRQDVKKHAPGVPTGLKKIKRMLKSANKGDICDIYLVSKYADPSLPHYYSSVIKKTYPEAVRWYGKLIWYDGIKKKKVPSAQCQFDPIGIIPTAYRNLSLIYLHYIKNYLLWKKNTLKAISFGKEWLGNFVKRKRVSEELELQSYDSIKKGVMASVFLVAKIHSSIASRGIRHFKEKGFKFDDKLAFEYFVIGDREFNDSESMSELASYYLQGKYVKFDSDKFWEYARRAASLGNPGGHLLLSQGYFFKIGVELNIALAMKHAKKSFEIAKQKNKVEYVHVAKAMFDEVVKKKNELKKSRMKSTVCLFTCGFCQRGEKEKEKFKRCSRCHLKRYCSGTCQKKHWKQHKKECKAPKSKEFFVWKLDGLKGSGLMQSSVDEKRTICMFTEKDWFSDSNVDHNAPFLRKYGSFFEMSYYLVSGYTLKISRVDLRYCKETLFRKDSPANYKPWDSLTICEKCGDVCKEGCLVADIMMRQGNPKHAMFNNYSTENREKGVIMLTRHIPRMFHLECLKIIVPEYPFDSLKRRKSLYMSMESVRPDVDEFIAHHKHVEIQRMVYWTE